MKRVLKFVGNLAVIAGIIALMSVIAFGFYFFFLSDPSTSANSTSAALHSKDAEHQLNNPDKSVSANSSITARDVLIHNPEAQPVIANPFAESVKDPGASDGQSDSVVSASVTQEYTADSEPSLPDSNTVNQSQSLSAKSNTSGNTRQKQLIADNSGQLDNGTSNTSDDGIHGEWKIKGKVSDTRQQIVSGAVLQLRPLASTGRSIPRQTRTDIEGRFLFTNLAAGEYRINVVADQDQSGAQEKIRTGAGDIELVVNTLNQVVISGRVTDTQNQPLTGITVSIDRGTPNEAAALTNEGGEYQISHAYPMDSNHRIIFSAKGYIESNEIFKITAPTMQKDRRMENDDGLHIKGIVVDDSGEPLDNVTLWMNSNAQSVERRMVTAEDGLFELTSLKPSADYLFTVSKPGYRKILQNNYQITDSQQQPMNIVLAKVDTGTVEGVVRDVTGNLLTGYSMTIRTSGIEGGSRSITTDRNGQFKVNGIFAGSIIFRSRAKPVTQITGAQLEAGQELSVRLIVDSGTYDIAGKVVDSGWFGVQEATVSLHWRYREGELLSSSSWSVKTDSEGSFEVAAIGPGERDIQITAQGYKHARILIEPENFFDTTFQLESM